MADINGLIRCALVAVVSLALASCASTTKKAPPATRFEAKITAALDINSDAQGRASPLVTRIYELASDSIFNTADFFDLYDKEAAVLSSMLIKRDEFTVMPEHNVAVDKKLQPSTRFVGVIAAYRNIDEAAWRAVVPITPNQTNRFTIHLAATGVTINPIAGKAPKPKEENKAQEFLKSLIPSLSFATDSKQGGSDGLE